MIENLYEFESIEELQKFLSSNTGSYYLLGMGSNILINPKTKNKVFIRLSPNIIPLCQDHTKIQVSAGIPANNLVSICQKKGLSGLEFATGVPATLGGMICMNFGAWGKSISEIIEKVKIIDKSGKNKWISQREFGFGYRTSKVKKNNWLVLGALINLKKSDEKTIQKNSRKYKKLRLEKQPIGEKTFGSIFKNPPNMYAGEIIEKLGFKGKNNGNVKISEKHANFLVNTGNSEFNEAKNLINHIQNKALVEFGINLELEVEILD